MGIYLSRTTYFGRANNIIVISHYDRGVHMLACEDACKSKSFTTYGKPNVYIAGVVIASEIYA